MGSSAQNSLVQAPGQVQQGSGKGSGEGREGFGAEPCQVQQGSGEGSGEGLGGFGAEPGQVQQRFRRRSGRLWCRARLGSTGFATFSYTETQLRCFQRLASPHASERFVKTKRCGCWGYHRSLFCFAFKNTGLCSVLCISFLKSISIYSIFCVFALLPQKTLKRKNAVIYSILLISKS